MLSFEQRVELLLTGGIGLRRNKFKIRLCVFWKSCHKIYFQNFLFFALLLTDFFIALHLEDILKYIYKKCAKFYYIVQCLICQRYFNFIKLFLKPEEKDTEQSQFLEPFICLSGEMQTGLPDLSSSYPSSVLAKAKFDK